LAATAVTIVNPAKPTATAPRSSFFVRLIWSSFVAAVVAA